MWRVCLFVVLVSCIDADLVTCEDGTVCPAGTTCVGAALDGCATPEQLALCAGVGDGTACTLADVPATCVGGVCLISTCGNARIDFGEACDDGNDVVGDGCSVSCRSNEMCGNGTLDAIRLVSGAAVPNERCDDGNSITHDGCTQTCTSEVPAWLPVSYGVPAATARAAYAYDTDRERFVMFGGVLPDGATAIDALWEWTGEHWWQPPALSRPSRRAGAAMAYDPVNHELVLFGGYSEDGVFAYGDTWTYNGVEWVVHSPTLQPRARTDAQMVYDGKRRRIVMFGGRTIGILEEALGDAYEWYDGDWHLLCDVCAPGGRSMHAMGYDPVRGVIVVFGGLASAIEDFDVHEYDGVQWTNATPSAGGMPSAPIYGRFVWSATLRELVYVGGEHLAVASAEVHSWNGTRWLRLSDLEYATSRHAIAALPREGRIVMFGGIAEGSYTNATIALDGDVWKQEVAADHTLGIAVGHRVAFDPLRGTAIVAGGLNANNEVAPWLAYADQRWRVISPLSPRTAPQLAYDPVRRGILVFGGVAIGGNAAVQADTQIFDGTAWTPLLPATSPPGRTAGAMSTARDHVVLFGGFSGTVLGDTWTWDGTTWREHTVSPAPPARNGAMIAYDPLRDLVVLYGGAGSGDTLGDTWLWDGASWRELTSPGPPARSNGAMAWSATRGRIVLYGGSGSGAQSVEDTWELDGTTWTRLTLAIRPSARAHHTFVPDGSGLVVVGGLASPWRFRWDSFVPDDSCVPPSDLDGDGATGCADPDCAYRCLGCGDGTCGPVESCRLCPLDCGPCPVLCGDGFCDAGETCAGECP